MMHDPFNDAAPVNPRLLTREQNEQEIAGDGIVTYGDRKFLEKKATWVQLFLFNDKPNKAADPIPFKIARESIDRIAQTAIGKPWIIHYDSTRHYRGDSNDPKKIVREGMQYARGTMVFGWRHKDSTNVNMIAAVYPEHESEVRDRMRNPFMSPYVSPLIFVKAEKDGQITDGEVLHVQTVTSPGYEPEIARVSGFCDGMLGDCLQELKALGAASKTGKQVGFELEDAIMHHKPLDVAAVILGASSSEKSGLKIDLDPTGFELEESMMPYRRR